MIQIVRDRVSDQVHRYLRDRIVQGEITQGTRLVEIDIAAELGVSRTPVREALWQLRSMDLIRQADGGGYEVTDVRRELMDILDIRAALEAHAVRRAADRISAAQLREIAGLCDGMEALPFAAAEQRAEFNRRFHDALVGAAGNARLSRMVVDYQVYFAVAQPLFDEGFVQRTQREHRGILEALNARDPDRAADLVTRHILGAADFLKDGRTKIRKEAPQRSGKDDQS